MVARQLVRVFVWTEGATPGPEYINQVLEAAVPEAADAIRLPVAVEQSTAAWPPDPWALAMPRLRAEGWADRARYELSGWAGSDSRNGSRLFVVSVFARPASPEVLAGPVTRGPGGVTYGTPPGGFPLGFGAAGPPGVPSTGPAPEANAYPNRTGITPADLDARSHFYVGFGPRLVAGLLDVVLLGMLEFTLLLATVLVGRRLTTATSAPGLLPLLLGCGALVVGVLIAFVFLADFWASRGQTPGMMLMGQKVVTASGVKPSLSQSLVRAAGYLMSLLPLGAGFLVITGDDHFQGLHDRMAGTFVVPVHPPQGTRPAVLPGYPPLAEARTNPPAAPDPPPAVATVAAPTGGKSVWDRPASAPVVSPPLPPAPSPEPEVDSGAPEFQRGLAILSAGVREPGGEQTLLLVDPEAAQAATTAMVAAATAMPGSAFYRYWVGVARRHGEGYMEAAPEFVRAAQQDPAFWEARMQSYFGPRWHDPLAYPSWSDQEGRVPPVLQALLPTGPGSRLVLLREGAARTVGVLTVTRRETWKGAQRDVPARVEAVAAPTPYGLVIALYLALRDDPQQPYRGEVFLNPVESPGPEGDATALGQNLILQLARQDHTFLIFADENGALLLNRRLPFDPATSANLATVAAHVEAGAHQALAQNLTMPLEQFEQAARWHIAHFPLERVAV